MASEPGDRRRRPAAVVASARARGRGRFAAALAGFAAALAALIGPGAAPDARAYEFEIRARTIGDGSELRAFRLLGADVLLDRRRFTQTLSLSLWDLGRSGVTGLRRDRKLYTGGPRSGPRLSFTSYLRVEHDYGAWANGSLVLDNRVRDAVDLVPELESALFNLDVLYAYFAAEGLLGGAVDVYVGRQLGAGDLDWWSMDGVTVRVATPLPISIEGFGGLRVRDASPLGAAVFELDGTGGGECAEYVEGPIPGSGSWRPIDVEPAMLSDFDADFDRCPQREQVMPTFGGAVETRGLGPVTARVGYRRSMSPTPGLIGPADRFENPDVGLYPNEDGQAPDWAVNEEHVTASVRGRARLGRRGQLHGWGAARYSLLHGVLAEAHLGARVQWGMHAIEPELYRTTPTFDGDSIFNVFSIQPYTDVRVTYDLTPAGSRLSGYARGWARAMSAEDEPEPGIEAPPDDGVDAAATEDVAAGIQVGGRFRGERLGVRLDAFHDGGYGGQRTGVFAQVRWRPRRSLALRSRAGFVRFDEDLLAKLQGNTVSLQAGASYAINRGVTVHVVAEQNHNRFYLTQFRLIGVLDLAFEPEL